MSAPGMQRYKDSFLVEAREHLAAMNAGLLALERSPLDGELPHQILRAAHTLKSMAATMDYAHIAELCHVLEDVLVAIRSGKTSLAPCVECLFEALDLIDAMLRAVAEDRPEPDPESTIERLRACTNGASSPTPPAITAPPERAARSPEPIQTVAVAVDKLDALLNLAEELLVARMRLGRIREELNQPDLSAVVETVGRLIADLQYEVMRARMVPVGFIFSRFPRMVRDLSRAQQKDVELIMGGGEIELDRGMIDELGEYLVHLLRNAVDHGIEPCTTRALAGKPARGTIRLLAGRGKQSVFITVEDDGAGLELDAIRRIAVQRGLLAPDASEAETAQTIFRGVSTTTEVTAVSGRGMGLNIVKNKAESIGGSIAVETTPGRLTRFIIEIPLTMAVIKTLFVDIGGRTYAIPVSNIERLITVERTDLKSAFSHPVVVLDRQDVSVVELRELYSGPVPRPARQALVIVKRGGERFGVAVDALRSTEEIVIKPLGKAFRENRYFAGSALIGSGEVVLVLDVAHLSHPDFGGHAAQSSGEDQSLVTAATGVGAECQVERSYGI